MLGSGGGGELDALFRLSPRPALSLPGGLGRGESRREKVWDDARQRLVPEPWGITRLFWTERLRWAL